MKYYIIAGEASGDLHAANLMRALKVKDANAQFRFFGGDLMLAEGGTLAKHYKEMAFMGFIPVLKNLDGILANYRFCKKDITDFAPHVVILVDYPSFNLRIAKFVKRKLNLQVVYFISPKIWAWKTYRIKQIKKYVDTMLSILPFETAFYQKFDYKIDYVGNPTVDEIAEREFKDETFADFITANQLQNKPIIAILPGSRKQEIEANLPKMLEAVESFTDYQPVVAGAPGITADFYNDVLKNQTVPILFSQTYRLVQQAEIALVTSGTATLETALLRIPQIVCYSVGGGRFTYWAFKKIIQVDYISLVNLIAGKEIVKELFAHLFSVHTIRQEAEKILFDKAYREKMLSGYDEVITCLGAPGASYKAAGVIIDVLNKN